MWNDEIVEQVRAVRRAHAAAHGNDLKRIFSDLKQQELRSDREVVTLTPAPPATDDVATPVIPFERGTTQP
jgi:hypothetical protein